MEPPSEASCEQSQKFSRGNYGLKISKKVSFQGSTNGRKWKKVRSRIICPHGFDDWLVAGVRKIYDKAKQNLKSQKPVTLFLERNQHDLWVLESKFKEKKDQYEYDELPDKFKTIENFKRANAIVPKTQKEITERKLIENPNLKIFDHETIENYVKGELSTEKSASWSQVILAVASHFYTQRDDKNVRKCLKAISIYENFSLENIDECQLRDRSRIIKQFALYQLFKNKEGKDAIGHTITTIEKIMVIVGTQATLVPVDKLWIDCNHSNNISRHENELPEDIRNFVNNSPNLQVIECESDVINRKILSSGLKKLTEVQKFFFQRLKEGVIQLLCEALNKFQAPETLRRAKDELKLTEFVKKLIIKEQISGKFNRASEIFLEAAVLFNQCLAVAAEYGQEAMRTKKTDSNIELDRDFIILLSKAKYINM